MTDGCRRRMCAASPTSMAGLELGAMHLLGTSGTVTTIAGVHLRLRATTAARSTAAGWPTREVRRVLDELRAMSYDERAAKPVHRRRARRSGARRLRHPRGDPRVFPCERLRVADRGLREGMLVQMMRADGVWAQRQAPRARDTSARSRCG